MSRDFDPTPGQWYEDLEREETFKVLAVNPDDILVRIQWLDREIEELDLDAWNELDLELAQEPEGWADDDEDATRKATTRMTTTDDGRTTRTTTGTTTMTRITTTRTTSTATGNDPSAPPLNPDVLAPNTGKRLTGVC